MNENRMAMEFLREFVLKSCMMVRNGIWKEGGGGSSLVLCTTMKFLRECVLIYIWGRNGK